MIVLVPGMPFMTRICTGHAYSDDGVAWTFSPTEPFGGTVHFTDESSITFSTRERPKFVYKRSTPIALITGVSASCSPPSATCCARCNRTTSGHYSAPTCSQCKHGWQHCEGGRCFGGSKGGMDYTYTLLEPLAYVPKINDDIV
eukprot:SAG31_NODE_1459_length_8254_cov_4.297854_7_plen_144_part_00